ncbi:MAG: hypothetical protein WCB70_09115 [Xanthobacteraceae bacterium]
MAKCENLSDLLGRVSKTSSVEIDNLIGEFEGLRRRLQTDGDRIQREIEEYKALSQEVMQPDEDYFPRRAELPAFAYNNRGRGIDR